jgi:hypothetical protein
LLLARLSIIITPIEKVDDNLMKWYNPPAVLMRSKCLADAAAAANVYAFATDRFGLLARAFYRVKCAAFVQLIICGVNLASKFT